MGIAITEIVTIMTARFFPAFASGSTPMRMPTILRRLLGLHQLDHGLKNAESGCALIQHDPEKVHASQTRSCLATRYRRARQFHKAVTGETA